MTAFNIVRFRVKPGREDEFVQVHRDAKGDFSGWRGGALIRTGDQTFCFVGEWDSFDDIVAARPSMIGMLDDVRDMLEDLGGDLGVTDPVSGDAVAEIPGSRQAQAAAAKPRAKRRAAPRRASAKKRATKAKAGVKAKGRKTAGRAAPKSASKRGRKSAAKRGRR